jgi:hypothetical protein
MKALAKQDIQHTQWYDYINFISGNKYESVYYQSDFITKVKDEKGEWIEYCGEPKDLEDKFEFVEE